MKIILILLFLFVTQSPLHATATIYVDLSASGNNDGSDWINSFNSLQDALANASSGEEIWVAQGTYYPDNGSAQTADDINSTFQLVEGVKVYGGFPTGGANFNTRNTAAYPTVLSGDINQDGDISGNAYHVMTANNVTSSSLIDGFTIKEGHAGNEIIHAPNEGDRGGGLLSRNSSPLVQNCSFVANRAGARGGGAAHINSSPTYINCSFHGNFVYGGDGGAISNESSSTPILINCTIAGNYTEYYGGGVYNRLSEPQLTNCIIWGNVANVVPSSNQISNVSSTPTLSHCLIQGFSADNLNELATDSKNNLDSANPTFIRLPSSGDGDWSTLADNDYGNLRLRTGSPMIDQGDSSANSSTSDLGASPRFINNIDLGAFEDEFTSYQHVTQSPLDGDDNLNGSSNFADYASGVDPSSPAPISIQPSINGNDLLFSRRKNAVDVDYQVFQSVDLDIWIPMIEGVDYQVKSSSEYGSQLLLNLEIIMTHPLKPRTFYKQTQQYFEGW